MRNTLGFWRSTSVAPMKTMQGRPKRCADRGGGHAVLARAGLRDDAGLAHAARQQDLAEHIVDLVRAGVVELVALEVDLRAAERSVSRSAK